MPEAEWKEASDVEWLKVSNRQIGEGVYGKVHIDRIKFKGQRPARVAVKRFFEPIDTHIASYEAVIRKLRASGVEMVKTGFVKHQGEWVQVQPLFGATAKGSKLKRLFLPQSPMRLAFNPHASTIDPSINLSDAPTRKRLIAAIAKVTAAGYPPAFDTIGMLETKTTPAFVVHDLDLLAVHERRAPHGFTLSGELVRWIWGIGRNAGLPLLKTIKEFKTAVKDPAGKAVLKELTSR